MSDQDVLRVAKRMSECFSASDWAGLEAILTDETSFESPTMPFGRGAERILQYFKGLKAAFPDMKGEILSVVATGNVAAVELLSTGMHTQPMHTPNRSIPATNKFVSMKVAFFYEVSGEKLVAIREYLDVAGFMAQLGLGAGAPA